MPSPSHQNFIFLLREHPDLAVSLARCAGRLPDTPVAELVVESGAEVDVPGQPGRALRGDLALTGRAADGRALWSFEFEVQLGPDPDKRWSLYLYRDGLEYRHRCPAWVVVFSPDAKVRWLIGGMFPLGSDRRPLVIEPWMLPPIRDLDAAIADPARAVLAATYANAPDAKDIATIALQAVMHSTLREPSRYAQLITNAIGAETMNQIIADLPEEDREPLSEWERRGASFVRGKEEGRKEGREEGREEGLQRGRAEGLEGLRATVNAILTARSLDIAPGDRAWIDACTSADELRDAAVRAVKLEQHGRLRPSNSV